MSWEREVEELRKRRAAAAELGGAEAVAKHHARGRLTVRERIDALVDKGSFREQGGIAGVSETDADGSLVEFTPTNAVIGTAKIDGRPVIVCGDDFTLRGGAYSTAGMQKAEYADRHAARLRVPSVRLLEAGGASVSGITGVKGRSGYDFVAGASTNTALLETRATVPMVAAALGPVAGYPAGRLVAAHFSLMTRDTAQVIVGRNGVVDNVAEDEADAFRQIRAFLSYLPSNVWEGAPVRECSDPSDRAEPKLIAIVPRESRRAYKMRRIVEAVADRDSFFELTPGYGRTQITGLARVAGQPVGVLANDPHVLGGSMTADGAQKLRRFVELCDTFHLPIVSLMDEPGFMIGTEAEKAGTIRYGMEAMFAVNQTAVPWFTVVVRKSFGVAAGLHLGPRGTVVAWPSAHAGLHLGPRGTVVAWPSAQSGSMPLESGIELAHGREIAEAADPAARRRELEAEYARAQSVFPRAEAFGVHDLIDPRETRPVLCNWIDEIQPVLALQRGPRAYSARP